MTWVPKWVKPKSVCVCSCYFFAITSTSHWNTSWVIRSRHSEKAAAEGVGGQVPGGGGWGKHDEGSRKACSTNATSNARTFTRISKHFQHYMMLGKNKKLQAQVKSQVSSHQQSEKGSSYSHRIIELEGTYKTIGLFIATASLFGGSLCLKLPIIVSLPPCYCLLIIASCIVSSWLFPKHLTGCHSIVLIVVIRLKLLKLRWGCSPQ